jgi:hypothetical protein
MTSDFRLIETACIHCLCKPVFGTELGKSSSAAFNSLTTLPKLVFTDCWDLANPNMQLCAISNLTCENYNLPLAIMPPVASQASDSVAPVFPSEYLESDVLEMPLSDFMDPAVPLLAGVGGLTCDRQIPYQSSDGYQPSSNLSSSFPSEPTFVEGVTLTG